MSDNIQQTDDGRRATIDGKPVVSRLLPQDGEPPVNFPVDGVRRAIYMAFSTRFDGKTIITGCGIGRVNGDTRYDIELTDVGKAALKVVAAHCENLFFCECRNASTAKQRAIAALKAAKDGAGVFIVCKNSEIYDEVNLIRLFGVEKTGQGAPLPAGFYDTSVSDPHLNSKIAGLFPAPPEPRNDGRPLTLGEARQALVDLAESPSVGVAKHVLEGARQTKAGCLFVLENLSEALITARGSDAAEAIAGGALRAPFPATPILLTLEGFGTPNLLSVLDSGFVDDPARGYGIQVLLAMPRRLPTGKIDWEPFEDDFFCDAVSVILSLIADSRVTINPVVADEKLNKARVKRGKPPIPPYWKVEAGPTVLVPGAVPKPTTAEGGTHASPRPHDRRGHPRHLKKGDRTVWVRECKINALLPHLTRGRGFYDVRVKP